LQDFLRFLRERCFVEGSLHQLKPSIAGRLSNCKRGMADTQAGMAALFDISLRPAKTSDQEIPQPLFRAVQIVRRIHRSQDFIAWNLAVERVDKPFKPRLADGGIDVLFFHNAEPSSLCRQLRFHPRPDYVEHLAVIGFEHHEMSIAEDVFVLELQFFGIASSLLQERNHRRTLRAAR
jgi:hypothetical protein